ncbi:MAG: dihydrolipoyl dehydrogenase, partial [Spirochaetes bacterium]
MANSYDYDLLVIGGGPGGYVGAIRASQLGLKTCVVEKDRLGGVCLNIGCIPSKALIHQAEIFNGLKELEKMGAKVDLSSFDYRNVYLKSRKAADMLSKGVTYLLRKNKIDVVSGKGRLLRPDSVEIDGKERIRAKNIIVATGSRPREIKGFEFDGDKVLSSNDALLMEELPESIVILGGGFIGVEFAHILSSFGVEVTIVELLDRLLPLEDEDSSSVLVRAFKRKRINVLTSTKAKALKKGKDGIKLFVEDSKGNEKELEAEKILVVVGRATNIEDIGLEDAGIRVDRGFVLVGDYYQTDAPGVYAIGDVVPTPQLAHVASKEGEIVAEYIAGKNPPKKVDPMLVPSAVYCEPQVASFGYKEYQLKENGIKYEKAMFPYRGVGKSVAVEKSDGHVKILFNPDTREILGASIVGTDATEIIHELLLAKKVKLLPSDIADMIHAHPTISEAIMESA